MRPATMPPSDRAGAVTSSVSEAAAGARGWVFALVGVLSVVTVLTAFTEIGRRGEARAAGADAFVPKGSRIEEPWAALGPTVSGGDPPQCRPATVQAR